MAQFQVCVFPKGKGEKVIDIKDDDLDEFDRVFQEQAEASKDGDVVLQLVFFKNSPFILDSKGGLDSLDPGRCLIELNDQQALKNIVLDLQFPCGSAIKIVGRSIKEFVDSLERYLPSEDKLPQGVSASEIQEALECVEVELQHNILFGSLADLVGADICQSFMKRYISESDMGLEHGNGC